MARRFIFLAIVLACVSSSRAFGADPKVTETNARRLYVPIPELKNRFGEDVQPLVKYVKAVQARAEEILAKEQKPKAKGLLIAIGIKSKKEAKVWCEAVDGEMPTELIQLLEQELGKLEAVDLLKGPAGYALEINLHGQKVEKFPEFPQTWLEAAKKSKTIIPLIPPEELFKILWPD
jgi:hypothetical protein